MYKYKHYVFCLIFFIALPLNAGDAITVVSAKWPKYTYPEGTGIYSQIVQQVFSDHDIDFKVSTYTRAKHTFLDHKADIIIGVYREPFEKQFIIPRWYLDLDYPVVAYYDSRKLQLTDRQQISALTAAWPENYEFVEYMPPPKDYYPITELKTGYSLLLSGRVDTFIDYHTNRPDDLPAYIKELEVIPAMPIYLAFQRTEKGERLAKLFDARMKNLIEKGVIQQIYGDKFANTRLGSFKP